MSSLSSTIARELSSAAVRRSRASVSPCLRPRLGVEQDDVGYIRDTFPIVRRKDEAKYGEYRTKRLILEAYDAMAEATATGRPYVSQLDAREALA